MTVHPLLPQQSLMERQRLDGGTSDDNAADQRMDLRLCVALTFAKTMHTYGRLD